MWLTRNRGNFYVGCAVVVIECILSRWKTDGRTRGKARRPMRFEGVRELNVTTAWRQAVSERRPSSVHGLCESSERSELVELRRKCGGEVWKLCEEP